MAQETAKNKVKNVILEAKECYSRSQKKRQELTRAVNYRRNRLELPAKKEAINKSLAKATAVAQPAKKRKNAALPRRPPPPALPTSRTVSKKKRQELTSAVTESTTLL